MSTGKILQIIPAQGWYGLFDTDTAMLQTVRAHAAKAKG